MATSESTDVALECDAQGFLVHAEQWTEQVAERIARENGIPRLTARQWEVIIAMRTAFVERGSRPWLHMLSSVSGVSIQELYRLFPGGPSRLVAKIAGIPKLRACL